MQSYSAKDVSAANGVNTLTLRALILITGPKGVLKVIHETSSVEPIARTQAEHGFGEHSFKERAQRVPLSLLFVCESGLTEFAAELSEFSLPEQCSGNSIPPVS